MGWKLVLKNGRWRRVTVDSPEWDYLGDPNLVPEFNPWLPPPARLPSPEEPEEESDSEVEIDYTGGLFITTQAERDQQAQAVRTSSIARANPGDLIINYPSLNLPIPLSPSSSDSDTEPDIPPPPPPMAQPAATTTPTRFSLKQWIYAMKDNLRTEWYPDYHAAKADPNPMVLQDFCSQYLRTIRKDYWVGFPWPVRKFIKLLLRKIWMSTICNDGDLWCFFSAKHRLLKKRTIRKAFRGIRKYRYSKFRRYYRRYKRRYRGRFKRSFRRRYRRRYRY